MLLVILGAGGHGQVVADILFQMRKGGHELEIHGFIDSDPALVDTKIMGLGVLGSQDLLEDIGHDAVVVAIGDNAIRRHVFEELSASEQFFTAIHPSAVIAKNVKIGDGAMICAGVVINPGTKIGKNAIVNTATTVDHHNTLGAHSHVAPGVNLGGNVSVGQGVFIGIGANVVPGVSIGENAIIGAGATVICDVPAGETWAGVPARRLAE